MKPERNKIRKINFIEIVIFFSSYIRSMVYSRPYMHTTVSITTGLAITRTTLVWESKVRRVMRAMAVVVLVVVVVVMVVVVVVVAVGSD